MTKRFILLYILVLLASLSEAGNISFKIKDKQTDEAIGNCRVTMGSVTQIADANGNVQFSHTSGSINLTITCIGYEELHKTIFQVKKESYTIYLLPKVTDLKQTVVTAQSKPVLATQSIYKVNTINSQQIYQRGAVTLNDVLQFENNNFISNDNLLGSSVSIGGISGQNVKIMVNGIALSGRENGNIDLGQLNLQNIKRVEMIQGPMSVIYGSNAMGGVINLITNTSQKKISLSARTYMESIGKYNVSLNGGFHIKKHQARLTLARNFFQGWTPSNNQDRFMLWKPKLQYIGDLYYTYSLNKKIELGYYGSLLNEKITNKGTPIISPYEGYAFDEYYKTTRFIHSITGTYTINEKSNLTFLNSYTYYQRNKNRYKKDLVNLTQIPTTNTGDQDSSQFNTFNFRGVYANHAVNYMDFSLGYEYNHEFAVSSKLSDDLKPISDLGIFASTLFTYKKWSVQPSARMTLNNLFHQALTPAVHMKFDPNSHWQWRASFARGFRTPSLKELYLQFIDYNHTIIGNENLIPEIGNRLETSLQYINNGTKVNNQWSMTLAYNDIRNMITLAVYNGHSVLRQYLNVAHYRNYTATLSNTLRVKNMTIKQGIGMIYVEQSQYIPQHEIMEYSCLLSYEMAALKTGLNINYKYNSKQPVISTDNTFLYTDPIHIANASIQRSFFNKSLQMQLGMKNLFNIQNSNLNGASDIQGNAHLSSNGMYLFPERSIYIDMNYTF